MSDMQATGAIMPARNKIEWGQYVTGWFVGFIWLVLNYSVLTGMTPFFHEAVKPAVSPEIIGRILGYADAAFLAYLNWLFTKPSINTQTATQTSPAPEVPKT